jgi:hypothetical protein
MDRIEGDVPTRYMTIGEPRKEAGARELSFHVAPDGGAAPSESLRVTPRKVAHADDSYEFLVSSTQPRFDGSLVVETSGHPRSRLFFAVSNPVKFMKDSNKSVSYQDWKLRPEGSQPLEIDLPGFWISENWGLQRFDREWTRNSLRPVIRLTQISVPQKA